MGTRVELRSPDPACNPYLEMALCLAAGLDGIKKGLMPPESISKNIYEMSATELKDFGIEHLPDTLKHAVDELEKDEVMKATLGEHIYNKYVEGKRREWMKYKISVSDWEINRYLMKY
jgi:glutamine synthetase